MGTRTGHRPHVPMSEPRPKLVAVGSVSAVPEAPPDRSSGIRVAFWVLVAMVLAAALAAAFQTRRVAELTTEVTTLSAKVTTLTGELATARGNVDAYHGRLVEIRGAVTTLQAQLGELDELVERDPLADASR